MSIIKHSVSLLFFISLNSLPSLQTAALVAQHAYPSPLYYPGWLINVPLSHSRLPGKAWGEGVGGWWWWRWWGEVEGGTTVRVADVGMSCVLGFARFELFSTCRRANAAGVDRTRESGSSLRFMFLKRYQRVSMITTEIMPPMF